MDAKRLKLRVGAVSYLNTVPLIWGMSRGPQAETADLSFAVPAECSRWMEAGTIDIGLLPVAEIARQQLEIVSDVGIACYGAVRSILLFSKVPWRSIRTLAADASSRTSVQLAKCILRERYGVEPTVTEHAPHLRSMLEQCQAALLIGDSALRIEPVRSSYEWLDLGDEWLRLTGLPMVFAAWAARGRALEKEMRAVTKESFLFGDQHLKEIIELEAPPRSIAFDLAETYLRRHIRFQIGKAELQGLEAFFELTGLRHLSAVGCNE